MERGVHRENQYHDREDLDPLYELELNSEKRVLHGLELADAQPRRSKRHPLKMFNCRAKSVRNCQSPDASKTTTCRAAVR